MISKLAKLLNGLIIGWWMLKIEAIRKQRFRPTAAINMLMARQ
jgi:hypothetical protein